MALSDHKITDAAIAEKGVVAAPDQLSGSARTNKMLFDRLIREAVKADYNGLIDALMAATGAGEIGAAVDGLSGATIQAILNSVKTELDSKISSAVTEAALTLKSDKAVTNKHIKSVELDEATGTFTFTRENGTKIVIDTALEKVAVNFTYDEDSQSLLLTLADGSTETVSLAAFVTTTEFDDSSTIEWSVSGSKVKAAVKDGSITDTMLSSALKAMLLGYVNRAATSATNAASSERNAASSAATANSAKYSAESAAKDAARSQSAVKWSENNAKLSETKASTYASSAAESIKHAPRINTDGKWELWSAMKNAYVATEYTAIGTNGTTPTIGANGNWYLGETDTGLPSRGEQGPGAEVYYIDLEGSYPNYTCPVEMAGIKAAYEAGKVLECRCAMGVYTATLPLFVPMPSANTWIFSGSGALTAMNFPAQSLTIAIVNGAVQASNTRLVTKDDIASPSQLGVVKPAAKKTDAMTRSIGVDDSGRLYTEPAAWYVNITGTLDEPIGDKTPAEIYQAYTEGYAVYVVVQMTNLYSGMPFTLPLVAIVPASGSYLVCFSTLAEPHRDEAGIIEITVTWNQRWYLFTSKIASTDDIPTTLKNPHALTITCGSNSVNYDGSEAKTIDIPAGVGDDTPDYVLTAADALAKKVVNHIGADNIVFAVMADAHLGYYTDTGNAAGKQAGQALKRLNERCALDFVAHVGDYTTGAYNTTVESAMRDMADYQLLIGSKFPGRQAWCVGNHDDAPYQATANRMSQTQVYAAISRKNLASNGYVPGNTAYGYMDFPALRLRLIYLDTHDRRSWGSAQVGAGANCDFLNVENISAAQLQWLADHALDFSGVDDPSKWSILVFSHAVLSTSGTYTDPSGTAHPCNTANAATLLKAYATKKSGSITHGGVTVNYNFTTVTPAGIIGCIHGHEHRYANEIVGGAFLSICCPNILNGRERVSADGNTYTKTAGTANGTSFCVFSVNRADKKIYVDHYGPGIDREFNYTVIDPSAPSYTNLLPSATDADGSIYNGVGWEKGYRLGSDGAPSAQNDSYLTGFIPVKFGDVVHLKNVKWQNGVTTGLNSGNQRVSFYSADKVHLGQSNAVGLGGMLSGVKDDNNIWTQFTVRSWSGVDVGSAAYFRLNCAEISGDSIITVNEEIT